MTRTIPAGFAPELQSLARIIFGFLIFRHGMEQVFGFPGAWREAATLSLFGALKLLCFPGGLLMMLGLFARPAALVLAVAHLVYWLVEPLPDTLLQGRRLFGAGGAPSDHILLPGFFFLYVSVTGPGPWSLDRLIAARAFTAREADREGPPRMSGQQISFGELGKIAYANQALLPPGMEGGLEATYYHSHPHADPLMLPDMHGRVRAQYTFSSAAHAAVVEVDTETGRVRVLRYVIVSDNGTLINPSVVDGQIYGSAAHGISVALGEGFVYGDDGQLLTLTLLDYGKSTTLETPAIEIEHYPVPDPFTTLGQKAAGEGAAIPSPAAIASAVEDALSPFGVKVRHLPLSPERVWQLIRDGKSAER